MESGKAVFVCSSSTATNISTDLHNHLTPTNMKCLLFLNIYLLIVDLNYFERGFLLVVDQGSEPLATEDAIFL